MNGKRRQRHLRAALGHPRPRAPRIRPGAPPGTLAPTESARPGRDAGMSFTRRRHEEHAAGSIDEALEHVGAGAVSWIDIDGVGDARIFARLGERLGLHPLALEDVLTVVHRPKVERYEKHLFIVMRMVRLAPADAGLAPGPPEVRDEQVSLFLGPDWLVTVQEGTADAFDGVREAIRHARGRTREAGPDHLAYLVLDAVVDAYFPVLDALAERMQELEEAAIAAPTEETLVGLQRLRHDLLALRRAVWPMREEVAVLQREDTPLVTAETRVFLRDVYDHAIQALELLESLRETSVAVMEVYLSMQNQRLNGVMKVLTVISTVFIPLTFIASIYGMNFAYMPELRHPAAYPAVLGFMGLVAAGMVLYFKRRGWW